MESDLADEQELQQELHLIQGAARDRLILGIMKAIDEDKQIISSYERTEQWENGWGENLRAFRASWAEADLIPKFIRPGQPIRWRQQFYQPMDEWHELNFVRMMQSHIGDFIEENGCERIHEFGCGTGINLLAMGRRFPKALLYGYDASPSAVTLTEEVGKRFSLHLVAEQIDMRAMPWTPMLGDKAGVFTFGALEQLGSHGFQKFIDYLVQQKPRVVVHIEPVPELLDPENIVDWLSLRFMRKRGYTEGLLPYLHRHEGVSLLEVERSWFGSKMIESYATIAWRVK